MGNSFPVITTNWAFRRVPAGLGAVVALGVLTACSSEPPPPPSNSVPVIAPGEPGEEARTIPPGEATPLEQEPPNEADVQFVRNMIVHHSQALEMAALAPDRAASKDVKGLASRIADVQRLEIDMMNRWLEQHDQPAVAPSAQGHGGHGGGHDGTTMPGMATPEQLTALENARGEVFDTLFLQMMITHHQGALSMAEQVRTTGVDIRVQELANDIVAEQTDDIRRMQEWLAS
jgi:uncharacterized protein (DUF305 family)